MIHILKIRNPMVAKNVLALQKAAYGEEMKWIGFWIPVLDETEETLKNSGEIFVGFHIGKTLCGVVSYALRDGIVDITRVAVHPDFFRKGIAEALIRYLERLELDMVGAVVTVAEENLPAIKLYEKLGFTEMRYFVTKEGLSMIEMRKWSDRNREALHE